MISALGRQQGRAASRTISFAVAAVVLVLHWAIPGLRLLNAELDARSATPGFSSGLWAVHRGTLPRLQPVNAGAESSLPKPGESGRFQGTKPQAVIPYVDSPGNRGERGQPSFAVCAPARATASRAFDARAPPLRA
jgi:hypothetical protein